MFYYKVKVQAITLPNSKIFVYGGSTNGFPARVIFTEDLEWGCAMSNEPIPTNDLIIEIPEVEFNSMVSQISSIEEQKITQAKITMESMQAQIDNLTLQLGDALLGGAL